MKKLLAIGCTVAFAVFWVFAGLSVLAWIDRHALFPAVAVISLLGLALGIWTRLQLVALTQDLKRGTPAGQSGAQSAAQSEATARI